MSYINWPTVIGNVRAKVQRTKPISRATAGALRSAAPPVAQVRPGTRSVVRRVRRNPK